MHRSDPASCISQRTYSSQQWSTYDTIRSYHRMANRTTPTDTTISISLSSETYGSYTSLNNGLVIGCSTRHSSFILDLAAASWCCAIRLQTCQTTGIGVLCHYCLSQGHASQSTSIDRCHVRMGTLRPPSGIPRTRPRLVAPASGCHLARHARRQASPGPTLAVQW